MRWHRVCLTLALVVGIGTALHGEDRSSASPEMPKAVPFKERFKWTGNYLGRVTRINAGQMTMTLQVEYRERKADASAFQRLSQLQQQAAGQQAQLARALAFLNPRNAGSLQNVRNLQQALARTASQMAQTQRQLYRTETRQKNVDVEADEKVMVRVPKPPFNFDDKGRLVKYTAEQLKELKGDPDLWGYPADFDRLTVGQRVHIFLGKTHSTEEEDPLVRLIYIVEEER